MEEKTAWEVATSGTYIDKHAPHVVFAVVLALALVIVALPSVGMLWARTDSTTENRELADAPSLLAEDGSFNVNVLDDAGSYFADHFAYRNLLVAANAHIRGAFGTSPTDQVVVGDDGWLYYGGTLPDYLGQSELSDRGLRNIAHNLALAQGYVESKGASFAFTLAPNKNTLYPEHMPYCYLKSVEPSNAARLKPLLEEMGVNYIDLFDLFEGTTGEWYLKTDSHWDNRGALMASQMILEAVGHEQLPLDVNDAQMRVDFTGDLESMLYPFGAQPDKNWYFSGVNDGEGMSGSTWSYSQGEDVTDGWVVTHAQKGAGSLLMFRDSFGNALLPLFASTYAQGAFSKLVPYNLPTLVDCQADTVIIERAERHLSYLAENPPIMPNPTVTFNAALPKTADADNATVEIVENGPYWMISGIVDTAAISDESKLFVSIEPTSSDEVVLDAFWTSVPEDAIAGVEATDFGYLVYIGKDPLNMEGATVRVYSLDNGTIACLGVFENVQPR
ncbi:MAG: hypothetical protein J5818_02225 [Eggerthellaceae bacterium]|nr:hypothetical protein [Eggerthellaceae bacterium]